MKKILYIHHGRGWGGAPKSLNLLLSHLDRSRFDPYVLCLYEGDAAAEFRKTLGAEKVFVDTRLTAMSHTVQAWYRPYRPYFWRYFVPQVLRGCRSTRLTVEHLKRIRPDLVHLNSTILLYEARAAKKCGIPLVWHAREPLSRGHFGLRYRHLRKQILELSDAIVGISKNDLGPFSDSKKSRVVYNPIDESHPISRESARAALGISSGDFVVGYVGFSVEKGIFEFLKAADIAAVQESKLRFLFLGIRPDMGADLIRAIHEYGKKPALAGRFVPVNGKPFGEFVPNPEQFMAAMDVLAVPYALPHFPRVLLEAFGLGVPVAAYNWGGVEELLEEGKDGIAVKPLDTAALASAFVRLARDRGMAQRLGENARKKAGALFSPSAHALQIQKIYESILSPLEARS